MKVMFRLLLAASVGLITTNAVLAQDFPRTGSVYNERESNYLTYECEMLNSLEMKCSFIQTMVIKPSKQTVYADKEKKLASCVKDFSEPNGFDSKKEICEMAPLLGIFDGSLSREEALKLTINGQKMTAGKLDEIMAKPAEISRYVAAKTSVITEICKSSDPREVCEGMLAAENDLTLRTCKVNSSKFEQSFSRLSSENTVWTVRDSASGECGIINVSRFEKDSDYLWRYISQKVVTNPSATAIGNMKCSEFDQRVFTFGWKHNGYAKNCDFIKFGF